MRISAGYKAALAVVILSIFGFCLGVHAIVIPETSGFAQLASSTIKMPLLLLLSSSISAAMVFLFGRLIGSKISVASLVRATTSCLLTTALALLPAALIVVIFAALENYSLIVLFTYTALSIAGTLGCAAFAYVLHASGRNENLSRKMAVSFAWLICFGFVNAEAGWKMRPLIGWTGQSFTIFRSDDPGMLNQIRCEVRNTLHFGGIKFPKAGEESDTKEWPC